MDKYIEEIRSLIFGAVASIEAKDAPKLIEAIEKILDRYRN